MFYLLVLECKGIQRNLDLRHHYTSSLDTYQRNRKLRSRNIELRGKVSRRILLECNRKRRSRNIELKGMVSRYIFLECIRTYQDLDLVWIHHNNYCMYNRKQCNRNIGYRFHRTGYHRGIFHHIRMYHSLHQWLDLRSTGRSNLFDKKCVHNDGSIGKKFSKHTSFAITTVVNRILIEITFQTWTLFLTITNTVLVIQEIFRIRVAVQVANFLTLTSVIIKCFIIIAEHARTTVYAFTVNKVLCFRVAPNVFTETCTSFKVNVPFIARKIWASFDTVTSSCVDVERIFTDQVALTLTVFIVADKCFLSIANFGAWTWSWFWSRYFFWSRNCQKMNKFNIQKMFFQFTSTWTSRSSFFGGS
jgi:hypothetical protein